jgi:hypothetical protein
LSPSRSFDFFLVLLVRGILYNVSDQILIGSGKSTAKIKRKVKFVYEFFIFNVLDVLRRAGGVSYRLKVFYEGQNIYSAIFIPPKI